MKKTIILFAALLLAIFATGCTISINLQDKEVDEEVSQDIENDDSSFDLNNEETVNEFAHEIIEATGAVEGPVTVTIEEGENFNEYLTYLKRTANEKGWFEQENDACHFFYKMTADQSYPIEIEDFETEEVKTALLEILGDEDQVTALTKAIVDRLNAGEEDAREICSGDNGVFVIFSESHTDITLTTWHEYSLNLEDLEHVGGLIDLSYSFYPDAFEKKAILMTGYGDAGYLSWNYYLINTRINKVSKVESCTGHFVYEESGTITDQFTFECEMEYTG